MKIKVGYKSMNKFKHYIPHELIHLQIIMTFTHDDK